MKGRKKKQKVVLRKYLTSLHTSSVNSSCTILPRLPRDLHDYSYNQSQIDQLFKQFRQIFLKECAHFYVYRSSFFACVSKTRSYIEFLCEQIPSFRRKGSGLERINKIMQK